MRSRKAFSCALVTGSSSGLGKALADFLTLQTIEVITTSSKTHDLSNREQRQKLLKIIEEKKPDLIINNAGFGLYGNSIDLPIEEQIKMIDVNISALVEISLYGAKTLLKNQMEGTILNISSAASFYAYPTFNVYCSTKAFVNNFSLALDSELKGKGVRILCACPGQITTHFRNRASCGFPQKKDQITMSQDRAVKHLWWQVQKGKGLYVFDWKTKWMVRISKLIPKQILKKILKKSLRDRYY